MSAITFEIEVSFFTHIVHFHWFRSHGTEKAKRHRLQLIDNSKKPRLDRLVYRTAQTENFENATHIFLTIEFRIKLKIQHISSVSYILVQKQSQK